jgi:ubiquitin carboxyl-terminal hydrolase 25/28
MGKINNADRNLLTDTSKLKSRFEAVMQDDPTREGIRQATPVEALTRLRKYIRDALNTEHDKRVFPANNKRFMEAYGLYGQDCKDLLQRLGFDFNVSFKIYARGSWTNPRVKGTRNELDTAESTSNPRSTELNR